MFPPQVRGLHYMLGCIFTFQSSVLLQFQGRFCTEASPLPGFHLDLLPTFLKIHQKHIFPQYKFTHKRLFGTDVKVRMTHFGNLIRNIALRLGSFTLMNSQSILNYEFKAKKGPNIWPRTKPLQCRLAFCDEPFKAKLKYTSFKATKIFFPNARLPKLERFSNFFSFQH